MLEAWTLQVAQPLAEQLDANGIVLTAIAGTPLDHLVKACELRPEATIKTETEGYIVDYGQIAHDANECLPIFDKPKREYVLGDIKLEAGSAVRRVIAIIKTKTKVEIGELVESINTRMSAAPVSQVASMEIVANDSSAALYNPALASLIEKYELMPPNEPQINTALPRLKADEIMQYLETGINSLDADVAKWVASVPPHEIEGIWSDFFSAQTSRADGDYGISRNASFSTLVDDNEISRLMVFLIARHLLENDVVLDNTEMSLDSYQKTLQTYVEQAGRLLNRQMEKNSAAVNNGVLVTGIRGNTITVNTPVYNSWLANGGSNEILFGMVMSGRPTFNIATIDEKRGEYQAGWDQKVAVLTSAESVARFNFLRDQLVLCYEDMLNREENEEGIKLDARTIFEIMRDFKSVLDCMTIEDSQDIYKLCLKLVCRTRYDEIPAEAFLLKMEEVSRAQPNLQPREAATMAMLDYICDWVASQFQPIAA